MTIITPREPARRGCQVSVMLDRCLLCPLTRAPAIPGPCLIAAFSAPPTPPPPPLTSRIAHYTRRACITLRVSSLYTLYIIIRRACIALPVSSLYTLYIIIRRACITLRVCRTHTSSTIIYTQRIIIFTQHHYIHAAHHYIHAAHHYIHAASLYTRSSSLYTRSIIIYTQRIIISTQRIIIYGAHASRAHALGAQPLRPCPHQGARAAATDSAHAVHALGARVPASCEPRAPAPQPMDAT